jgi:ribonucleoside-diphosphate reductase alpha chain
MDVEHPDIMEHLTIREEGSDIQDLSFGVTVSDAWMESMINGDVDKRKVWAKILEVRFNTGYPYIFFTDNANKNTVDVYKDKGMKIHASNLCTEIMLPSNDQEAFICCLASMNVLKFDEWENTRAVELMIFFLDTVLTDFIQKLEAKEADESRIFPTFMIRALNFAKRHRALGLGVLGLASYYQHKNIAFSSINAKFYNAIIFKTIKDKAYGASKELADRFGEPEILKGYGRRNSTLMAVAPTKSSSFILGQDVSEGIEPWRNNIYIKDLAKIKYLVRNPFLEKLLISKEKNTDEIWDSIAKNSGSVRHLDFLTDDEKDVFLTMSEISPRELVIQAATRQRFIDQGQSLNLMIHPKTPVKEVNQLIIEGWKLGLKSFYYQHSVNAAQEYAANLMSCVSCEA